MIKVGITGSIATGKSNVTKILRNLGYFVINCDDITHDLLDLESVRLTIKDTFGKDYVTRKKVNRKALASLIFSNKEARQKLNQIIHPLVNEILNSTIELIDEEIVFIEVALLYETNMENTFDKIVVVYADEPTQTKRLMKRDKIDFEYAVKKIQSQMSINIKKEKADYLIDNNKSKKRLITNVDKFINELRKDINNEN